MASASPVSFGAHGDVSEAELEAELKELLAEDNHEAESNNVAVPELPHIPEETPMPKRARTDRLAQLRAQLEEA